MYARVVQSQLKAEALARGVQVVQEQVLPDLRRDPGFQGTQLLIERPTGRVVAITRYASEEAAREAQEQGFRRRVGLLEGLLAGQPSAGIYEVLIHDERGQAQYARASQGRVQPDALEDTSLGQQMAEAAQRQPGYAGFLLLADRANQDVLGLSYWESLEALEGTEGG